MSLLSLRSFARPVTGLFALALSLAVVPGAHADSIAYNVALTPSLAGDPYSSIEFLNGNLYNISFAQNVGTSLDRYTLHTPGFYAFYSNDGEWESFDSMSAVLAAHSNAMMAATMPAPTTNPTPEPGGLLLLGTALAGGGLLLFRRKRVSNS